MEKEKEKREKGKVERREERKGEEVEIKEKSKRHTIMKNKVGSDSIILIVFGVNHTRL